MDTERMIKELRRISEKHKDDKVWKCLLVGFMF